VIHLVDDRGRALDDAVEACFHVELRSECVQVLAGTEVRAPAAWHGLRIEGAGHGPLNIRREEVRIQPDGSFRVAVVRKALLQIEGAYRKQPLTVSLYPVQDATFRTPSFRAQLDPGENQVRVPAGDFVAALTVTGSAPDLQRLAAAPGGRVRLTCHLRQGWSLVVRCKAASSGRLVSRAAVNVADDPGFGRPQRLVTTVRSEVDGLALVSGLSPTMASLSIRHPEFLAAEVHGLTAGAGRSAGGGLRSLRQWSRLRRLDRGRSALGLSGLPESPSSRNDGAPAHRLSPGRRLLIRSLSARFSARTISPPDRREARTMQLASHAVSHECALG
jgi:hypothetical protein